MTDHKTAVRTTKAVTGPNAVLIFNPVQVYPSVPVSSAVLGNAALGSYAAPDDVGAGARRAADPTFATQHVDMGKAGNVRAAVAALVLTVVSALAVFPFILPSIPA